MNKKLKMVATAAVALGATGSVALSLAQSAPPVPGVPNARDSVGSSIYSSAFSRAISDVSEFSGYFSGCRVDGTFESKFMSVAFGVSSYYGCAD